MTLLLKTPYLGGMKIHDLRRDINIHNMAIDCDHVLTNRMRDSLFVSKIRVYKYKQCFETQSDDIRLRSHQHINKLLDDYVSILIEKQKLEPEDTIEVRLQRRYSKPYMSTAHPHSFKFPSNYHHVSIDGVQHFNTENNVYEMKDIDTNNTIKKELSQGFMFTFENPQKVTISPSTVHIRDPFEEYAYEDVIIVSYTCNKKLNNI